MNIFIAVAITMVAIYASPVAQATHVGDTPSFKLTTINDRKLDSATVAGKLVAIHFWSMRSRPSIKIAPVLVEAHKQHQKQGVVFIGICIDHIPMKHADAVAAKQGFTWFQSIDTATKTDTGEQLTVQWQVKSIPSAILISPKGGVLWIGHPAKLGEQITAAIKTNPPRPIAKIDYENAIDSLRRAETLASNGAFVETFRLIESISPAVAPNDAMKTLAMKITPLLRPETSAKAKSLSAARDLFPDALSRLKTIRDSRTTSPDTNQTNLDDTNPPHTTISENLLMSRLRLAERYAKSGNEIRAFDVYQWLAEKAPQTAIGKEAIKKVAAFKSDPAFMTRHKVITTQRRAIAQLAIAEELNELKQFDQARVAYQKVIDTYPATVAAAKAMIQMEKLPKKKDTE